MKKLFFLLSFILIMNIPPAYARAFPFSGDMSAGINGSDDNWDSYMDLVLPLAGNSGSFLFLAPRISMTGKSILSSEANEFNIGVGFRTYSEKISEKGSIIGANLYYDSRNTDRGNNFRQAGAGFEYLSGYFDARINAYIPLGSTERFTGKIYNLPAGHKIGATHYYEISLGGIDAEAGFKIPLPSFFGELRVFGGFHYFDAARLKNPIKGFKARAEYRPVNILRFNYAVYDGNDYGGSRWQAGASINVPFDFLRFIHSRNPFKGFFDRMREQGIDVKRRMGEMVVRDMHVRTEKTGTKERKDFLKTSDGEDYSFTVVSPDGNGIGTFEDPASLERGLELNKQVKKGVAALLMLGGEYNRDSELVLDFHKTGRIEILGAWYLSKFNADLSPSFNDLKPVIKMQTSGAVSYKNGGISPINDILIAGIRFEGSGSDDFGIHMKDTQSEVVITDNEISNFSSGIIFEQSSSTNVFIVNNIIENNKTGISALNSKALIAHNEIKNNAVSGIAIMSNSTMSVIGNSLYGNGYGISSKNSSLLEIEENIITSNTVSGIFLKNNKDVFINDNDLLFNGSNGIDISSSSAISVSGNIIKHNKGNGIILSGIEDSKFESNTVYANDEHGFSISGSSGTGYFKNIAENNGKNGIYYVNSSTDNFAQNHILSNKSEGFLIRNSKKTIIQANSIYGNKGRGLNTKYTVGMGYISNAISSNSYVSYSDNDKESNFEQNTFTGNKGGGYIISNSTDTVFYSNAVKNNNGYGINAVNSSYLKFENNNISGNGNSAFHASNLEESEFVQNMMEGNNKVSGVSAVYAEKSSIYIRSNLIDAANVNGLHVENCAVTLYMENNVIDIARKGHGIYLKNNPKMKMRSNIVTAEKQPSSYYGLYMLGTTTFAPAESGYNKFIYTGGYGGDQSAVIYYKNNVLSNDQYME